MKKECIVCYCKKIKYHSCIQCSQITCTTCFNTICKEEQGKRIFKCPYCRIEHTIIEDELWFDDISQFDHGFHSENFY